MARIPSLYGLVPVMVLTTALLMVSTIPYPAFKQLRLFRPHAIKPLLGLVAAVVVICIYPQNAVFLIFFAYVLLGPVGLMVRLARRLFRPKPGPVA